MNFHLCLLKKIIKFSNFSIEMMELVFIPQIKSEVCEKALIQLSIMLCHRHTYIRRSTATRLYESLLVNGDASTINADNLDQILQVLGETNWEEPVEVVKPIRNSLCLLMGVRVPTPKIKPAPVK